MEIAQLLTQVKAASSQLPVLTLFLGWSSAGSRLYFQFLPLGELTLQAVFGNILKYERTFRAPADRQKMTQVLLGSRPVLASAQFGFVSFAHQIFPAGEMPFMIRARIT